MKRVAYIKEAQLIGADSYVLLSFDQLPLNASKSRQVDALRADRNWLNEHCNEISRRIDKLIQEIEQGEQ